MEVNSDFMKRVVVHSEKLDWVDSPMPGVRRRMLDRIGNEVARATTIVQYAPNSQFSSHVHTGGEEFIVLDGVFQDEHGDFPEGCYIRNPPQSSHTPGSKPGCTIFVKLWQFDMQDRTHININMHKIAPKNDSSRKNVSVTPLYKDQHEDVRMETWGAGSRINFATPGGAELLVLSGEFQEADDTLVKHSWLRVPTGGKIDAKVGPQGARVWIKTGHLNKIITPSSPSE